MSNEIPKYIRDQQEDLEKLQKEKLREAAEINTKMKEVEYSKTASHEVWNMAARAMVRGLSELSNYGHATAEEAEAMFVHLFPEKAKIHGIPREKSKKK